MNPSACAAVAPATTIVCVVLGSLRPPGAPEPSSAPLPPLPVVGWPTSQRLAFLQGGERARGEKSERGGCLPRSKLRVGLM